MEINNKKDNMQEQWIRWEPAEGSGKKYYIDLVSDAIEGFTVLLSEVDNRKKKIKIIFEDSVDAYKNTDESFRLKTINTFFHNYEKEFYSGRTFFKIINSRYIKWLSEESYGISDSLTFIHFVFFAADSILDVVTTYEPKVEFIEE